ncbi:MAG: tetratricopeptide repeat protein [Verrucomicrobia bacterium]|nr:tetratricopeptide repeat protein [Verrucomicrobiota bacterium]
MKIFLCTVAAALALAGALRAETADDQFVEAYQLIQQADSLQSRGQAAQAWERYQQAQAQLKRVQAAFPNWNDALVKYRLNYVADKLKALQSQNPQIAQPSKAPPAPQTAPKVESKPAPAAPTPTADGEFLRLRNESARLAQDNSLLQAKLKEALAAQPRASDPREFAKAEEQVRTLQKERDLLQVSTAQQREAADRLAKEKQALQSQVAELTGDNSPANQLKQTKAELQAERARRDELAKQGVKLERLLNDPNPELSQQVKVVASLSKDKQSLEAQVGKLSTSQDETARQLEQARTELKAERSRGQEISRQYAKLEKLLTEPVGTEKQAAAPFDSASAKEKQALEKQVQQLSAGQGETARQLEQLRAELKAERARGEQLAKHNDELEAALKLSKTKAKTAAMPASEVAKEAQILQAQVDIMQADFARVSAELEKARDDLKYERQRSLVQVKRIQMMDKEISDLEVEADKQVQFAAGDLTKKLKKMAADLDAKTKAHDALARENTKLLAENKNLAAGKPTGRGADDSSLARQLKEVRARLDVLAAQKVPFSAEELALFKPKEVAAPTPVAAESALAKAMPPSAQPLLAQAQRAFAERKFDEAEARYQEILILDPSNVITLADLAAVQLQLNKFDAAEANLKKALARDPDDAFSLSTYGLLKFRQNKMDDALSLLSQAAALNPRHAETQNYLGLVLSQKGNRSAAETAFRKAIQLAPGMASAHHNLAVFYSAKPNASIELARWHYKKALAGGHAKNADLEKAFGEN